MSFRVASMVSSLVWSSIASASPDTVLQPVEVWGVDYGATQCTAARSYGTPEGPVVLGIVPSFSGSSFKLLVNVPQAGPIYEKELQGTVDFGDGGIKSGVLYFGAKGVKQSVYQFSLPAAQMERARTATTVSFLAENGSRYTFALSNMAALLDDLHNCTGGLQQAWNMGAKSLSKAEAPIGNIRSVFTAKDYPVEALKLHPQGAAQYQLLVDDKGAVARCDVVVASGLVTLDTTGCQVLQEKARFRPAVDAQGKAVRSVWTTPPITWSVAQNSLDSGCTMVSSDSRTLLNTCARSPSEGLRPMQPGNMPQPTPPPTSTPSAPGK